MFLFHFLLLLLFIGTFSLVYFVCFQYTDNLILYFDTTQLQAVEYCVAECEKWAPCLSFDIDVVKQVCYLSATRSQPTHSDGNAALFIRIQDFNNLKNVSTC